MTNVFNPVEELRRNGLVGSDLPETAQRVLNTLTEPQVDVFIKVKQRVDALQSPEVQANSVQDGSLAIAMTQAMGWDRPRVERVGGEVEGMSVAGAECACLCTGSGGGGGKH
jgi:hypothetical protein